MEILDECRLLFLEWEETQGRQPGIWGAWKYGWDKAKESEKWISIEESFPETFKPVLCFETIFDSQFVGKITDENIWVEAKTGLPILSNRVTHWKRLSNPPFTK